jgi:hypothetical protein
MRGYRFSSTRSGIAYTKGEGAFNINMIRST